MAVLMKEDYHMEVKESFASYDIVVKVVTQKIMKKDVVKSGFVIESPIDRNLQRIEND